MSHRKNTRVSKARWARRLRPWYVYNADALEDEANGALVIAVTEGQARAIWRREHGLGTDDIDPELVPATPAQWQRTDAPEPVHPKRAGVWWPSDEEFRGYGFHFVDDPVCCGCGDWVAETDEDYLCPDCAEREAIEAEAGAVGGEE